MHSPPLPVGRGLNMRDGRKGCAISCGRMRGIRGAAKRLKPTALRMNRFAGGPVNSKKRSSLNTWCTFKRFRCVTYRSRREVEFAFELKENYMY